MMEVEEACVRDATIEHAPNHDINW